MVSATARRLWRWMLLPALLAPACGKDHPNDAGDVPAAILVRVGGDWQRAPGLAHLEQPLAIRAIDAVSLAPLARVPIRFAIERGSFTGAQLSDTLAMTDRDGVARTELTLGPLPADTVVVTARIGHRPAEHFSVLVSPAPVVRRVSPHEIRGGDTVTLTGTGLGIAGGSGSVRFGETSARALFVSDTLVRAVVPPCLASDTVLVTVVNGGARAVPATAVNAIGPASIALAPFDGVIVRADQLSSCLVLTGAGAHYVAFGQIENDRLTPDEVSVEVGATAGPAGQFAVRSLSSAPTPSLAFERTLRRREAALASVRAMPGAFARAVASVPAAGAIDSFRVISALDASAFATATVRLKYAGRHILVWVDTLATPELADTAVVSLARLFDDVLYPLDEDAFGEPSDVDGNDRVHVVLTPIVNALTARNQCTLSGFVGGFFSAHDLYPGTPNANGAEVFYAIVPDSLAQFGCAHPFSEFSRVTRTAFSHELQHVISYNQHVFLRSGVQEDDWLNEGMSHIAEELASKLYERRYPAPFGRASPDQLFPDSSQNFILFNLINAFLFLHQPHGSSVTHFSASGTLEERGGAWLFLRYLADQYGEDILRRLVQTPLAGKANIVDKTGEPFSKLFGDFAIAVYADSIPGFPRSAVPSRWRYRTRNWRVIFHRLNVTSNFPEFPIEPYVVPFGGSVSGPIRVGGFVALSIDVPADATSTVLRFVPKEGGPWPPGQRPQMSIFRLPQ